MEAADLVIEAAVSPVAGQALDHGVQHLDAAPPARRLKPLKIRQCGLFHCAEEEAAALVDLVCGQRAVFAAVAPRGVVLHVDDQQRRMVRVDLDLTAQDHAHPSTLRKRASATGSSRARRAAQAASPAGSAIRSWRISISTWGR